MCATHGSLLILWITVYHAAHSSADMIILMDSNNIQAVAQICQLWMNACIFLEARENLCLIYSSFLHKCIFSPCLFSAQSLRSHPGCTSNSAVLQVDILCSYIDRCGVEECSEGCIGYIT